mmetsp:Transcript_16178/g.33023  ORF Transcript_16178/g.33023 Transcript_16178/m.33023 type:complete len:473 (+) Transcript_16178:11-1429(+)
MTIAKPWHQYFVMNPATRQRTINPWLHWSLQRAIGYNSAALRDSHANSPLQVSTRARTTCRCKSSSCYRGTQRPPMIVHARNNQDANPIHYFGIRPSSSSSSRGSTTPESNNVTKTKSQNDPQQQQKQQQRTKQIENTETITSNQQNQITSTSTTPTDTTTISTHEQIHHLQTQIKSLTSQIQSLTYQIQKSQIQSLESTRITKRSEARSYIIEQKLLEIQSHVGKLPALEDLVNALKGYLMEFRPGSIGDAVRKAIGGKGLGSGPTVEGARWFMTSKYAAWISLLSILIFWRYRVTMYQRTSEEVANVASMTLQQDSLRKTIQETLTTVANSPETLSSLSLLFQSLITEERTEKHLIDLIVRALNSEGVRLAAIDLLDECFRNEYLQGRAGEFLKVAARGVVLDEGVQKDAGVGIKKAVKSALFLPWWLRNNVDDDKRNKNGDGEGGDDKSKRNEKFSDEIKSDDNIVSDG